jgi:hypothetical protein
MEALTELSALSAGWYSSNHFAGEGVVDVAHKPSALFILARGSIMRMGTQ